MKIAKKLVEHNTYTYNLSKASEELQELSLALIQKINKPAKVDDQEIIDEIGDVKIRLAVLNELFDKNKIDIRVKLKKKKFERFLKKYKDV